MKKNKIEHYSDKEALEFHNLNKSGKIEINSSKPMTSKRDLALAYSPGVAAPVKEIYKNPDRAYDYTTKGNLVAVISNGSAILGLGNLGAIASKPVMEGKAVLFKRFADIDAIDLEIDSKDPKEIVNSIKNFAVSFGGINLEDIAAPNCFEIEENLKEILDIPVFHDDQHGTAIITSAALINSTHITKKKISTIKVVVNGAGASAMACSDLFIKLGVKKDNLTMIDSKGVISSDRKGLNRWKLKYAKKTKNKNLNDALQNADVFLGLSSAGILKKEMIKKMAKNPIIFACANPDPEILPEEAYKIRKDAIIASFLILYASSGKISGSGLAQANMIGFFAICLIISFFKIPAEDNPRKTSAFFNASLRVLSFVFFAYFNFHLFNPFLTKLITPLLSIIVKLFFFTPNFKNRSEQAIADAPAPFTTTLILEIFFFVICIELMSAADVIIAVPCWSS